MSQPQSYTGNGNSDGKKYITIVTKKEKDLYRKDSAFV